MKKINCIIGHPLYFTNVGDCVVSTYKIDDNVEVCVKCIYCGGIININKK